MWYGYVVRVPNEDGNVVLYLCLSSDLSLWWTSLLRGAGVGTLYPESLRIHHVA